MTQPAPQPATTTITTTTKRIGIGDFTSKMLGLSPSPTGPVMSTDTKKSMLATAGSIFGDYLTEGSVGALFGAAHAQGWLEKGGAAWDGIIGLASGFISVVAAPYAPTVSRYAARIGRAGITTFGFRKGFEFSSGGKPMMTGEYVRTKPGEDRISAVAEKLDLL